MGYLYDFHVHTKEGSACSIAPVRELVKYYRDRGFSGFILTDHFSGNTSFPDGISWEERVNRTWEIYDAAQEECAKYGDFKVFFGIEFSLRSDPDNIREILGNDFIVTNITKEWMLENEDAFGLDFNAGFDKIRAAGGFISHAHPFLEEDYIKSIQLLPRKIDAVEIINAYGTEMTNGAAKWYADTYNLPYTAGSDMHNITMDNVMLAGVETENECETVVDLINAVKNRQVKLFWKKADDMLKK